VPEFNLQLAGAKMYPRRIHYDSDDDAFEFVKDGLKFQAERTEIGVKDRALTQRSSNDSSEFLVKYDGHHSDGYHPFRRQMPSEAARRENQDVPRV
jgi:hypothetical protein